MSVDIYFVVWGKKYLDLFLEIVLPSYFSSENIPRLKEKKYNPAIFIQTDQKSAKYLKEHPYFQKFASTIEIQIYTPTILLSDDLNKYQTAALYFSEVFKSSFQRKNIAIMASPDALISDGALHYSVNCLNQNIKIVTCPSLFRSTKETIVPKLNQTYFCPKSYSLSITPYELNGLLKSHMHSYSKMQFFLQNKTNLWHSTQFTNVENLGFLGKSFHFHPYVIDFREISLPSHLIEVLSKLPLDGGVLEKLGFLPKHTYVIQQTKNFCALEISPQDFPFESFHFSKFVLLRRVWSFMVWQYRYIALEHIKNYMNYTFFFPYEKAISSRRTYQKARFYLFLWTFPSRLVFISRILHPKFVIKKMLYLFQRYTKIDVISWIKRKKNQFKIQQKNKASN